MPTAPVPAHDSGPPLAGLVVERRSATLEAEVAAWVLAGLGAGVWSTVPPRSAFSTPPLVGARRRPRPAVVLCEAGDPVEAPACAEVGPSPPPVDTSGLPEGTLAYATGVALAAAALAAVRSTHRLSVSSLDVALQLFLPQVMAASYRSPTWPAPPEPVPAAGGGWLNCELGAPGAGEDFRRLLATLPPRATAAEVAAAAQEWRLPVCEYSRRPPADGASPILGPGTRSWRPTASPPKRPGRAPLAGVVVCDLTSMWAGPLATWLLARLGADVDKVEPSCRLDGTRAVDGRGIHPGGESTDPGNDSALYNALNSGKRRLDLDLTDGDDRRRLMDVIAGSDVLVDSFSPRVMPNLGLEREAFADRRVSLLTLSLPAFPQGPRRPWVAYGTGVHAASGLGDCPDGSFRAPAVTYPDPLAGLTACVAILAGLVGRDRGWRPCHLEVPLLAAVRPLLRFPPSAGRLSGPRAGTGQRLLRAAIAARALEPVTDGGGDHLYPRGPFRGDGVPAPTAPAPRLHPEPAGSLSTR